MELKSPPPCPPTVTIRRNPPRKARATPSSDIPLRQPFSSPSLSRDIFSTELPQNPSFADGNIASDPLTKTLSENLKVYLRIRPLTIIKKSIKNRAESKNAWPKNPKPKTGSTPKAKRSSAVCVEVNGDLRSVTVRTPLAFQETKKRIKSEVYEGFSHVFGSESTQCDVYKGMVEPLVDDFLKGQSGMIAAIGPSGSGKTHTVFGCARDPGMVPLALRRIFGGNEISRVFYLSMFEISSEKGKAERMNDLLHDGGDISMQHSVLKGLKEAVVCDAQQAESLIAHGMFKRATAMTNSNSQSSRSQCIINIRRESDKDDEAIGDKASSTMLTIVDLAGAEREKKTGNQGARLLESNFINNTSMVFGLCLRALLEHQKNRNKPLQKHYKNSLLTRYMKDYLEGKKRMMLILTVKPGEEDYLDTSFLLRQASPFTKIKFKTVEDPVNLICNKRPNQAFPWAEQLKKMKFSNSEASLIDEGNYRGLHFVGKEIAGKVVKDVLNQNIVDIHYENLNEVHVLSDGFDGSVIQEKSSLKIDYSQTKAERDREYQIMQGLSKALWTVLKQYKKKLEGVEIENCLLRDSLTNEKTRSLDLENDLTSEKKRLFELENELKELKSRCTCCCKASADMFPVSTHDDSFDLSQYKMTELQEVNSEVSSYSSEELEQTDPSANDSILTFVSSSGGNEEHYPQARDSNLAFSKCSGKIHEQCPQQLEDLLESNDASEDLRSSKGTSAVDMCSTSQVLSASAKISEGLFFHGDTGIVEMSYRSEATSQLASACLYTIDKPEKDALNVKNVEPEVEGVSNGSCLATSLECRSAQNFLDYEKQTDTSDIDSIKTFASCSGGVDEQYPQDCLTSTKKAHKSEQDAVNIEGVVKNLNPESECASNGSSVDTSLECETKSLQDCKDIKDSKGEDTQLESTTTDGNVSLVEDRIVPVAAHSRSVFNSTEFPQNDDKCFHVDEEQHNNEDVKEQVDPTFAVRPEEGWDLKTEISTKVASRNFQHTEKTKRRLRPASSVLLKDIHILDIRDESDRPKGGRGGKRVTMDDKIRTQGSLSLINLITGSKLDK